ncbi:hypothetical protein [Shimia sp. Alg240-R146]|uniref:hypothetical protein n=1 Tax=Shimia sp. Alg240-R146 TaxID=2993449 RepID=UPI0022E261A3|nr:hypothetical protein [Shimia sp. Alg240-R146]
MFAVPLVGTSSTFALAAILARVATILPAIHASGISDLKAFSYDRLSSTGGGISGWVGESQRCGESNDEGSGSEFGDHCESPFHLWCLVFLDERDMGVICAKNVRIWDIYVRIWDEPNFGRGNANKKRRSKRGGADSEQVGFVDINPTAD